MMTRHNTPVVLLLILGTASGRWCGRPLGQVNPVGSTRPLGSARGWTLALRGGDGKLATGRSPIGTLVFMVRSFAKSLVDPHFMMESAEEGGSGADDVAGERLALWFCDCARRRT